MNEKTAFELLKKHLKVDEVTPEIFEWWNKIAADGKPRHAYTVCSALAKLAEIYMTGIVAMAGDVDPSSETTADIAKHLGESGEAIGMVLLHDGAKVAEVLAATTARFKATVEAEDATKH